MAGNWDRSDRLMGLDGLGLLTGTRRAGDWSGPLPNLTGLSVDSRQTRPGHLFAALPGSRMHGADFTLRAANGRRGDPHRCRGLARAEAEGPLKLPGDLADSAPGGGTACDRRQPLARPARGDGRGDRHQR